MGGTVTKNLGHKFVDEVSDGFDIKDVVQMADGNTPEIVTNHA
jgi:hypothetical protein